MDWLSSAPRVNQKIKIHIFSLSLNITKPFFCKLWDDLNKSNMVKWFWNATKKIHPWSSWRPSARAWNLPLLVAVHRLHLAIQDCSLRCNFRHEDTMIKDHNVPSNNIYDIYILQNTRLHQNRLQYGCTSMFIYCIYRCWWWWWWWWWWGGGGGGEKSRKRVFDRSFNGCFESAAPLRMIREPSSSSSNTNGRSLTSSCDLESHWLESFTRAMLCWQRWCSYTGRCPCLRLNKRAPLKALSFGAGKKGEHMVKTSRIFLLGPKGAVDPLILKEDASSWRKNLKTATGAALLFSEAWTSSTKLQKKCQNICIFHGPPLCKKKQSQA